VAKDFYPVIMRAVEALDPNTPATRRAVYDRARKALLAALQPFPPDTRKEERAALEAAISRIERGFEQLLSSAEFNQARPDDTDKIGRSKSKWRRGLDLFFLNIAIVFTGLGVVGGVGIVTPVPIVQVAHSVTMEQNTQLNLQHETGRSADPPNPPNSPTPLGNALRRVAHEREAQFRHDRLLSLQQIVTLLRDLRFKLVGSSALLDRLDNLLDVIARSADKLIDDRELIDQMFDLARTLAEIEETKDKEERDREISDVLREMESIIAFANAHQ
jgi:hypothetical protein